MGKVAEVVGSGGLAPYMFNQKANKAAKNAYGDAAAMLKRKEAKAVGFLQPYSDAGETALSPLTGLLTGNQFNPDTGETTAISPEQRDALLYQSPGYRFALDQTQQALARSQNARGNYLSGGAQKEISQYTSGMASQYSNDYINQLVQLAGMGQNAAGNQASVVTGLAPSIANMTANQGLTQSNYYAGLSNNINSMQSQALSSVGMLYGMGAFGGGAGAAGAGASSDIGGFQAAKNSGAFQLQNPIRTY